MVVSQTYSFLEDVRADCIKTGMLYSQELVTAIGDVVKKQSIPIVVDPVMVSSAGDKLLQDDAIQALQGLSFPLFYHHHAQPERSRPATGKEPDQR